MLSVISSDVVIFGKILQSAQPLACRLLEAAVGQGKIANAYLLCGRAYADKMELARQIACYFNCQAPDRDQAFACVIRPLDPSSHCLHCQWIGTGEHPQAWLKLAGEGKSGKIPVEKARLLTEELAKTSAFVRVVVVPQADETTFHRPAANALLKCIEEPPPNVLFFFLADSADDVLSTIVSRCQVVPLSRATPLCLSAAALQAQPGAAVLPAELGAKLDAARADFVRQSRQYFEAQPASHQYFKTVTEGLALGRQLQELSKELKESMEEQEAAEQVLDVFIASEMEALKRDVSAAADSDCSFYLGKLLALVERTKRQINQYVKPTNAMESFGLAQVELRQSCFNPGFSSAFSSGDISLAKR